MIVSLQPIVFRGRLAAAASRQRFFLAPHVEALEPEHPDRVFVSLLCCYARDVLEGTIGVPYSDADAAYAVRLFLMPDDQFAHYAHLADADVAEYFAVPLDQVVNRRADLDRADHLARQGWLHR